VSWEVCVCVCVCVFFFKNFYYGFWNITTFWVKKMKQLPAIGNRDFFIRSLRSLTFP